MTGYTPEDVIGKTPRILESGRHGEEYRREMWRAIRRLMLEQQANAFQVEEAST